MLQKRGETPVIKLIDFGMARTTAKGDDVMTTVCGTWLYTAPEILERPYRNSCDIWSLVVTVPEKQDLLDILAKGSNQWNPKRWACQDPRLLGVVQEMLEMDPSRRPSAKLILKDQTWVARAATNRGCCTLQ
eukprot:TRINITY_DN14543_c0_g1_i1.p1 TRINITY_DN14543_c0_g1~~TRINITY_DN14543_c0_g1_i1.p1  ORF type:complete len:132 (+),score=19.34 TRINITY_DN14543_c0_g1_i1:260-655(+)